MGALFLLATIVPLAPQAAQQARATANEAVYAINAGPTTAPGGPQGNFTTDAYFTGGSVGYTTSAISIFPSTYNAAPAAVYQSVRYGSSFSYTFGSLISSGKYTVRLHFNETAFTSAGQRQFNVAINGTSVLSNYDIFADSGGKNFGIAKVFKATASSANPGVITIAFTTGAHDLPSISGIEIVPDTAYGIAAVLTGYGRGRFQADQYSSGSTGTLTVANAIDASQVESAPSGNVYQNQRYSNATLTYTLPGFTSGSSYTVHLHFCEVNSGITGAGQRVFDAKINGTRVLNSYDPYAAAGGLYKASERHFTAVADGSGNITVALVAVVGNAEINGIEVAPITTYKFNSNGPAVSPFDADRTGYYSAFLPSNITTTNTISTTGVTNPAPMAVYQRLNQAVGLAYILPALVPGDLYHIRLHFTEFTTSPTNYCTGATHRLFDIQVQNLVVVSGYDIYAAAGNTCNQAVVKELTYAANALGQIIINLAYNTASPTVAGVEVYPEAVATGYHVSEIGALGLSQYETVADGGTSGLVGGKMVWFMGDTSLTKKTDSSTTPPGVTWWTNIGRQTDTHSPWTVTETLDSGGSVKAQMVPFNSAEITYNQAHMAAEGCTTSCDGTYDHVWAGTLITQTDSSGLVFAGTDVTPTSGFPGSNACPPHPSQEGMIAWTQPSSGVPGTNGPDNSGGTGLHKMLFPAPERRFAGDFVDADGYVYAYTIEPGNDGTLNTALTSGNNYTSIAVPANACGEGINALAGDQFTLLSGSHAQTVTVSTNATRATTISVNSFTADFSYPTGTTLVHGYASGLTTALTSGNNYTSLAVNALPGAVVSGELVTLASGTNTQVVTASATAAAGSTSISVNSFNANFSYPNGSGGTSVEYQICGGAGTAALCAVSYVARAGVSPVGNAATRANYTFWNQNLSSGAGGWDTSANIGKGTPLRYSDSSSFWGGVGTVSYNAYLGKYVAIGAAIINGSIWLSTSSTPYGPFSPQLRVVDINSSNNFLGDYFTWPHPEMNLDGGQTMYVSYYNGHGGTRIVRVELP